jgi:uncharacterized SAM-binding protein YcdF (DUF218 family)
VKTLALNIKGFIVFLLLFTIISVVDVLMVYHYFRKVNRFIENQPITPEADAGVVFFGDYIVINDQLQLGPDSKMRAFTALELYMHKRIQKIVCVGGYDYLKMKGKPHLMKEYFIEQGVPACHILYDSVSYNTITNWQQAEKIIKRENFKKLILVSAPFHLFRISKMVRDNQICFQSWSLEFNCIHDYWILYRTIHHEWMSNILSLVFRDQSRNRFVYLVRSIIHEFNNYL